METSEAIRNRWSPEEYTDKSIPREKLLEIFEAVRWTQSSFNEQPWRFFIATKNPEDQPTRLQLESYLAEGNAFAKQAFVLGISFFKKTLTRGGKSNRHALHDVGAASQILALKAYSMGLNTRFMAGFDWTRAQELCPPDFEPAAMFVIGHATPAELDAGGTSRRRRSLSELVYAKKWGESF